jgi:DnaJ-class molecular chaperone
MAADPYSILGVARSASEKEVKSAYRKLAKELHPDHNKDNPKAAERFAEVTNAYDLLSDKDKRAKFDRGEIDADGNPTMPFGGGGGLAAAFQVVVIAAFATKGALKAAKGPICLTCSKVFSVVAPEPVPVPVPEWGRRLQRLWWRAASASAQGRQCCLSPSGAFRRGGHARQPADHALFGQHDRPEAPAGVENGQQMRLAGKGEAGPGGPGDAIITIEIGPHPFFVRDGDNIRLDLPVTLDEAVNGAKVKVPTVDGAVMLTVAPGSSSGRTLRLKGKGFSRKEGERGDQLVTLQIDLPADDADLKARLEGWTDSRNPRARLGL